MPFIPRGIRTPTSSKAALRAELEAALENYRGPVTLCPPAAPPEPDRSDDLSLVDEDEVEDEPGDRALRHPRLAVSGTLAQSTGGANLKR
jgi:hypothetical protein